MVDTTVNDHKASRPAKCLLSGGSPTLDSGPWQARNTGAAEPRLIPDSLLDRLRSADADIRVKALHAVCPCGAGFGLYERLRGEVKRLQKDPDSRVREMALHVERDACEIEAVAAGLERAAERGWRYSDADWVRTHRRRQASRYWLPR